MRLLGADSIGRKGGRSHRSTVIAALAWFGSGPTRQHPAGIVEIADAEGA